MIGSGEPGHADGTADRAREIALRQLESGPRSAHQLRTKMVDKDIPLDVANAVLLRLEDVGLVDDAEFARLWVRSRHTYRGLSRSAIRRELRLKGVADELIDSALEQVSDDDEHARAMEFARRKVSRTAGQPVSVRVQRLAGMLARRGYAPGVAFSVARDAVSQEDSADEANMLDSSDPTDV